MSSTDRLNTVYPRLRPAVGLLRADGEDFISIDDAEAHNIRNQYGEVFAEEIFAGTSLRKNKDQRQQYGLYPPST
ncbi:MAG: hypothetical protein LBP22_05810 [Deltaproteobacteria bacterium]|nr:hypothetical protein [Deltaproteobacteria bacterium]